jgi:hypothetical protein
VEEPQVDAELVPVDVAMHLSPDEREPLTDLAERVDDPVDEGFLSMEVRGTTLPGPQLPCHRGRCVLLRSIADPRHVGRLTTVSDSQSSPRSVGRRALARRVRL